MLVCELEVDNVEAWLGGQVGHVQGAVLVVLPFGSGKVPLKH